MYECFMYVCMYGWMDGWMDGCMFHACMYVSLFFVWYDQILIFCICVNVCMYA